jgi:two-component system, LytTR family, response regulator
MSRIYTALVVDDERLARKELISLLNNYKSVLVVGEAWDVNTAEAAIKKLNPDILFLDIQMPGESGFDLLDKIYYTGKIIFVTAFDEYAIRAFEINALDYLLKPVNPERLENSLLRLKQNKAVFTPEIRKLDFDDNLFLLFGNQMRFIKVDAISCIQAAGDYTQVCLKSGQTGLVQKSMREWEGRLPENYFVRIHRSAIVNIQHVDRMENWHNHSMQVYVHGYDNPVVMSRRYVTKLKGLLG